MKALSTATGIAGLEVCDLPTPEPGQGEVRVRVRASALNPADQKVLGGEFVGNILHGKQKPLVTGYDLAGTVEAAGPGADLAVGDEVFGFLAYGRATRRGAFAEAVVVPSGSLARRPATLSPGEACALATAGATALQALRDNGRLKAGQHALVVGASGGVGSLAIGVAKKLGASVTGACGAAAAELVRALGATTVIVRGQDDPLRGGQSYDVVFDPACAYSFAAVRHLLRPGGAYVPTLPSPGLFLAMGFAPLLGRRAAFLTVRSRRADLEQLAAWAADGLTIPIDSSFAVRDLGKALARLARGGMKGRIVIDVEAGF
jgi:NADPH:quinone reductase-like Zn-dependent oxidoreductase